MPAVETAASPTVSVKLRDVVASANTGALLAAAETTISKVSLTESVPSLAVTFTETVPTSAAIGVPENVRVAAAKLSHEGNAVSSDWVGRVGQRVAGVRVGERVGGKRIEERRARRRRLVMIGFATVGALLAGVPPEPFTRILMVRFVR